MKLYIVRHGIAYEPESTGFEDDRQRPLTAKGREKVNKIANTLKKLGIQPDLILSSPYTRAEQTASVLAKILDRKKDLQFSDLLIPMGKPDEIIGDIIENHMLDELMIVSHEPCISLLISTLVAGNLDLAITIKNGGVCCLAADDLRIERRATIEWLLTPKISTKI
jgi:phosphohistidine phosphatase